MGDDLTTGGMLPLDDMPSGDKEFDPGAVESDDMLDDFIGDDLLSDDLTLGEEEDPLLEQVDE